MRRALLIGIAVLVALGIGAAYALFGSGSGAGTNAAAGNALAFLAFDPQTAALSAASVAPLKPRREAPPGFREYYNETYRFSLFYPGSLAVREYDEGGGASTITLQDPAEAKGLQIFVVPYGAAQVSEERFREDVPSGIREGIASVTIDGATGASFFSANPELGETAEVWFIYRGYLYEITTLRPLAPWLSDIMQTWKFR